MQAHACMRVDLLGAYGVQVTYVKDIALVERDELHTAHPSTSVCTSARMALYAAHPEQPCVIRLVALLNGSHGLAVYCC